MTKSNQFFIKALLIGGTICAALISSRSALAQYSSPVRVLNTPAQSMPMQIAPQIPVGYTIAVDFVNSNNASGNIGIPAGGRNIINLISVETDIPSGQIVYATLSYTTNGVSISHRLHLQRLGTWSPNHDRWFLTLPLQLIVDGNTPMSFTLTTNGSFTSMNHSYLIVTGYRFP